MKNSSSLRKEITKMDIDPGYFCKFIKDQIVLNFIIKNNIKSVVDIGCDTCYIFNILKARKYKLYKYIGIDKINNINIKSNKNFTFIKTNDIINNIYLENIECILLLDIIEHLKNKEEGIKLLDKVFKEIKQNSYIIITTPNSINNKINWPKYHKYEYNYVEIINFIHEYKNIKIVDSIGWSMSNEISYKFSNFNSLLPIEINKVLNAIKNPEYSRDIMIILKKI
jgi:hypothetical protein